MLVTYAAKNLIDEALICFLGWLHHRHGSWRRWTIWATIAADFCSHVHARKNSLEMLFLSVEAAPHLRGKLLLDSWRVWWWSVDFTSKWKSWQFCSRNSCFRKICSATGFNDCIDFMPKIKRWAFCLIICCSTSSLDGEKLDLQFCTSIVQPKRSLWIFGLEEFFFFWGQKTKKLSLQIEACQSYFVYLALS